jgi:23S rRNA (uridine2552-2'-O)-methyltransferase
LPDHVVTFQGDARTFDPRTLVDAAGGSFAAVLSDMAPDTTGHGDAERSIALCHDILDRLDGILQPTGHLAMKVLEGSGYPELLAETRRLFAKARAYKPKASRDVSREMYIVGAGYVPER